MGVKGIDGVEQAGKRGALRGQIGGAAAAEDHHVDGVLHGRGVVDCVGFCARGEQFERRGVPAGEHARQLHVLVLRKRQLHAPAQVAVPGDADANLFHACFSFRDTQYTTVLVDYSTAFPPRKALICA